MSLDDATVRGIEADAVRDLLARGLDRGILSRDQAQQLAALASETNTHDAMQDSERLRFVTGFADIFVTIGIALFLGSASYLGTQALGDLAGSALVAALAWALAEFFSRRRRLALPSIVLLLIFTHSVFATALWTFPAETGAVRRTGGLLGLPSVGLLEVGGAALLTLVFVALHYWRFRVPITVAACTAALLGALVALTLALVPALQAYTNVLMVLAGLASFALAMRFDLSDPGRVTRATDIAFWLHLLAAPLIVHPVLKAIVLTGSPVGAGSALLVLAAVLLLSLVALVTDRRAILVSGLAYAGYAVGTLIREVGAAGWALPISLLVLGAFVLLLSIGWQPLRRAMLSLLPGPMRQRLPHPIAL